MELDSGWHTERERKEGMRGREGGMEEELREVDRRKKERKKERLSSHVMLTAEADVWPLNVYDRHTLQTPNVCMVTYGKCEHQNINIIAAVQIRSDSSQTCSPGPIYSTVGFTAYNWTRLLSTDIVFGHFLKLSQPRAH